MKSYKDYLALKGLKPIVIERTTKKPGELILRHSFMPAEVVK